MSAKEEFLKRLDADLTPIFEEAYRRYDMGREKYGTFDPVNDPRDMKKEMLDEVIDLINYAAMLALKIKRMKRKGVCDGIPQD